MKKPLIVYLDHGVVSGYKLPKGTEVLVVDLDQAREFGQESKALRWMRKVSSGFDRYAADLLIKPCQCWYEA